MYFFLPCLYILYRKNTIRKLINHCVSYMLTAIIIPVEFNFIITNLNTFKDLVPLCFSGRSSLLPCLLKLFMLPDFLLWGFFFFFFFSKLDLLASSHFSLCGLLQVLNFFAPVFLTGKCLCRSGCLLFSSGWKGPVNVEQQNHPKSLRVSLDRLVRRPGPLWAPCTTFLLSDSVKI